MKKVCLSVLVLLVWVGATWGETPVAVSPGGEGAVIGQTCPTFSWSAVGSAVGYKVEVFERQSVNDLSHDQMRAVAAPVLSFDVHAPALSWTPSSLCVNSGTTYVWYVGAVDSENTMVWSSGKMFEVDAAGLTLEQKDAVQAAVKEYLSIESAGTHTAVVTNSKTKSIVVQPSNQGPETGIKQRQGAVEPLAISSGLQVLDNLLVYGNVTLNSLWDIYLTSDTNHGLGWYASFAGTSIDGPVLYGFSGGALATTSGGNKIALKWDSSGNVSFGSPVTRHTSIPGSVFQPYSPGQSQTYTKSNGILYNATGTYYGAVVNLPDGAVVSKMTVHYLDNSASNLQIDLRRLDMTGLDSIVADFLSSGASATWQTADATADATYSTIDNGQYAYDLLLSGMDGTANHRLGGVTIEYTVTQPLP